MKIKGSVLISMLLIGCDQIPVSEEVKQNITPVNTAVLEEHFGQNIDPYNLHNYADQEIPSYINKDNTDGNEITSEGATLGRVLFYDKNLSVNNTVSCASCHQQTSAFSDGLQASEGVNGTTARHSMRLINSRFADEEKFFWDERATTLEIQTTMPIQDHTEMGFSGTDGSPGFDELIDKLAALVYYQELFTIVYGDTAVTESRVQSALAQFIRSIQSFDSKYDMGRAQAANDNLDFDNYTAEENLGKDLFMRRPEFNNNGMRIGGGAGCDVCHRAPEFDIDPNTRNNGVTGSFSMERDTDVTRAPTLRDLFNAEGELNTPLMHTGDMDIDAALAHYNDIGTSGNNIDRRLIPGQPQQLALTTEEISALKAFLKSLSGSDVYTNPKWSDPFL